MKKIVLVLCIALASSAVLANMLVNPGFEVGAASGATPTNWWQYGNAGQEAWAANSGTNGYAFYSWNDGGYGGVGQDVLVNISTGQVFTFSVDGLAEAQYSSSANETWMKMEFWNAAGDTMYYALTNDIYSALTGAADTWNTYSFTVTNDNASVGMVKPMFGGGNWTDTAGAQAAKWDDATFLQTTGAVPEPSVIALMLIGLGAVYGIRRRRS